MRYHSTTKECSMCGRRYFSSGNCPCANEGCTGTMCRIITPLPGKRVSGVLCRDRNSNSYHTVNFIPQLPLMNAEQTSSGMWKWPVIHSSPYHHWTIKEWKAQYGKLPRKGSKQMVIIELTDGKRTAN